MTKARDEELTQEYLRSILDYDPETGVFTWKWRADALRRINRKFAGKVAGTRQPNGYRYIVFRDGDTRHRHGEHRLAFLWAYGFLPENDVDHIDGNPSNNSLVNLRLATRSENLRNARLRRDNSSGHVGVGLHRRTGKWRVYGTAEAGRNSHVGLFETIEEAITARKQFNEVHGYTERHGEAE